MIRRGEAALAIVAVATLAASRRLYGGVRLPYSSIVIESVHVYVEVAVITCSSPAMNLKYRFPVAPTEDRSSSAEQVVAEIVTSATAVPKVG